MTPSHLRRRSMSADLERTELCEASLAYPSSPSEQQVRFDTLLFLAVFVSSVVSIFMFELLFWELKVTCTRC